MTYGKLGVKYAFIGGVVFLLRTLVEEEIIMLLPKRVKYRRQHRPNTGRSKAVTT